MSLPRERYARGRRDFGRISPLRVPSFRAWRPPAPTPPPAPPLQSRRLTSPEQPEPSGVLAALPSLRRSTAWSLAATRSPCPA